MRAGPGVIHRALKQQLERALATDSVSYLVRRRIQGRVLILAYHGVVPTGQPAAGERALFIPQRAFADHLSLLADVADVVALARLDEAGDDRPRVAITFDDAYHGAVTTAVAELARRNLPATIFVAPGRLNGHAFWWDRIAHEHGSMPDDVRQFALSTLAGGEERVHRWASQTDVPVADELPAYARSATIDALHEALALHSGLTFGSHTWSHPSLPHTSAADRDMELRQSLEWLRGEFADRVIPWLAYPYGLESPESRLACADAGYTAALRISGGWHRARDVSAFARPRLNIPSGLSVDGLRARLSGAMRV